MGSGIQDDAVEKKEIVYLYGGAGSGKSTTAAGIFYKLKMAGYNCEMNREYIKGWVWENREVKDGDQLYFFAKQSRVERILMENNLDFIISDSPLYLSYFYGMKNESSDNFHEIFSELLTAHENMCRKFNYEIRHFFIERTKHYNPAGRFEDEETAKRYDIEIKDMLKKFDVNYKTIPGDINCVDNIIKELI